MTYNTFFACRKVGSFHDYTGQQEYHAFQAASVSLPVSM
jgi:hypothetical protein